MVGGFDIVSATVRGPAGYKVRRLALLSPTGGMEKCGCEDPPSTTEDTDPTFAPLRVLWRWRLVEFANEAAEAFAGTKA